MTRGQKYYARGKARARCEAIEWSFTFSEGKVYYWSELSEWCEYFTALGKRFGLLREFRENGII